MLAAGQGLSHVDAGGQSERKISFYNLVKIEHRGENMQRRYVNFEKTKTFERRGVYGGAVIERST